MVNMPDDASGDENTPNDPDMDDQNTEDSWFAFVRENDDVGFQIIRVNLSLDDHANPSELPIASVVTVPYAGNVNWPEDPAEWERLSKVEDQLLDRVTKDFRFAGVLSAGFSRDFVFYGPRPIQRNQLECDSVGDVLVIEDPEWEVYEKKLLPTRPEMRRSSDDEVIRAVSEHGDHNDLLRPVDHYFYFETAENADRCLDAMNMRNPSEATLRDPDPENDQEDYCVHVIFEQSLEQPQFSAFTLELEDLAEQLDGVYDGWETPLAKPDEANTDDETPSTPDHPQSD